MPKVVQPGSRDAGPLGQVDMDAVKADFAAGAERRAARADSQAARAARAEVAMAAPAPRQVAVTKITNTSHFDPTFKVTIDPYGLNPLEEDARQHLHNARMRGTAPKMFMGGTQDLPLFSATGLDPRLLLKLPYQVRHYAAAETSLAAVHGLFEQYADLPFARLNHEGLSDRDRTSPVLAVQRGQRGDLIGHAQPVTALVDDLQRRGLPLPDEVVRGRDLRRSFTPEQLVNLTPPASLLALNEEQIWQYIRSRTLLDCARERLVETGLLVSGWLVTEIATILIDSLDGFLDHLRPPFNAAGLAVHQATQLGIKPTMGADKAVELGDTAVAAWRTLPGHLRVLEDLAQLRIRFTDSLGADPLPDPLDAGRVAYATCFAPGGLPWKVRNEDTRARWLRLATSEPVRLLTVAETRQLVAQGRTLRAFQMVEDDDGALRYTGIRQS